MMNFVHLSDAKVARMTMGAAPIVGIVTAIYTYEADLFWQDEGFVFGAAMVLSAWGLFRTSSLGLHDLYLRENAAIGMARLGVILGAVFCAYVLLFHADPTIVGIATWLYVLMAFASIKLFGQLGAEMFGPRLRVDVYERKNLAAGTFIGAFTLATGMIFAGAMWGDMEADSLEYGAFFEVLPGYVDGWWITPWFFLMGWVILVLSLLIWSWGEKGSLDARIVRDRRMEDAQSAAYYCIACAIIITYAVQGDYHGFWHSLFGFSFIALPVIAHGIMKPRSGEKKSRHVEGLTYIGLAVVSIILTPLFAGFLGFEL